MEAFVLATTYVLVLMVLVGLIVKIKPVLFVVKMVAFVLCQTTNANVAMAFTERDVTKSM